MAKKNLSTDNFGVGTSWTPTVVNPAVQEWANKENTDWRLTPAARSKVVGGATKSTAINRKPESSEEYTKRRVKEETKRTWRSDVADVLHGIGEGALSLHPYTAIPYYGAKVGMDFLNGNYGWLTALNASVPLFHLSPQITRVGSVTKEFIKDAANTTKSYVSHPTYQTVYHGSPVEFNVSEAHMGTPYDMGLHVGDKTVADIMKDHRGVVYKLRIPKEQAVTSDLSRNGINHIKTDYKIVNERAGYGELGNWDDYKNIGKTTGVDWNIDDNVLMDALRSLGIEGKNYVLDATGYHTKNWPSFRYLRTDENTSIHINPREQLTKNLSEVQRTSFNQEADKLLAEFSSAPNTEKTAIIYNTKAANLLHKYGINVVKYWNRNPMETLNSSWFITDPSVIDVMPNMSLSKYKGIWGNYYPEFNLQNSSEVFPINAIRLGYAEDRKENNYKQGGKMTTIEFLKNGSGIHIKKKNRGKFTSYCGGKVTDSCIRRAKASGNPTLVKRATFAANARKWKHLNGGILTINNELI